MRYGVVGADKDSGADIEVVLSAPTREAAEMEACKRGILISNIKTVEEEDSDMVPLATDDLEPVPTRGSGASSASRSSGLLSHPIIEEGFEETRHSLDRSTSHTPHVTHYHVIMNQSLYLLEASVMKHVIDGWEPQGGMTTGFSNNAVQFYQAMVRRK